MTSHFLWEDIEQLEDDLDREETDCKALKRKVKELELEAAKEGQERKEAEAWALLCL